MNRLVSVCVYLCSVCSYSKLRRQSLDIFQGDINGHNPQDELVLRFLRENHTKKKRSQGLERVTVRPTYESCCSFWMSQVPLRILNDFKEMGCNRNLDSLIPKSFTCRHESLTRHFQPSFSAVVEVTPESFEVDM